jgi:hypothetical protein
MDLGVMERTWALTTALIEQIDISSN